jgi:hypothetical protein
MSARSSLESYAEKGAVRAYSIWKGAPEKPIGNRKSTGAPLKTPMPSTQTLSSLRCDGIDLFGLNFVSD